MRKNESDDVEGDRYHDPSTAEEYCLDGPMAYQRVLLFDEVKDEAANPGKDCAKAGGNVGCKASIAARI